MGIDYHTIIVALVFLLAIMCAIWILPGHHFQKFTCIILYFIAILPNIIILTSQFTLDNLIMTPFNSVWIYILFSTYLGVLLFRQFIPRNLLARREKVSNQGRESPEIMRTLEVIEQHIKSLRE
ncbi:MAG: hypothetical protein HWN65_05530 [Candidatus Helarchaeota archaeon]|nr:hypothetical protein [Candidatus Helarchaeota archaeon]